MPDTTCTRSRPRSGRRTTIACRGIARTCLPLQASLALLRAFAAAGGRRAVVAGTSAEYDWHAVGRRCHERRTPLRPATLYGAAKHALHTAAAPYAEQVGFELAWGRVFFVYGPWEPEGRLVPSV